jgi:hypothetical protein
LCGSFPHPPLARLAPEHQSFLQTFVLCRGVIRDVEKRLGISYPTVRARLDAAVTALEGALAAHRPGGGTDPADTGETVGGAALVPVAEQRRHLLEQVAAGLLDPAEAADGLRRLSDSP